MSNPITEPKPKKSWPKILGSVAAVIVLLIVALYFVATSGAFIKSFVLPKAGAALKATITAEDVSLSPFLSLTIRQLKVVTTGNQPLLTAAEARVHYSLFQIIGGSIDVDEVTLIDPVVNIVVETNGTSNLTPLMGTSQASKRSESPSKPLNLKVRNVKLQNGQVQFVAKGSGLTKTIGVSGLNISLDQLINNQPGKLALAGAFRMEDSGSTNPPSIIAGKLDGAFNLTLNDQLLPTVAQGTLQTALSEATGTYVGARGMAITLNADTTATEIKQLAIRFTRDNQLLSELSISGPLNTTTLDARLKISLSSINKEVLGLVAPGMDFGATVFNSTNEVTLLQKGQTISVTGSVQGRQISIITKGKKTPVLSGDISYAISVDLLQQSALLQNFDLKVDRQSKPMIFAHLKNPMTLSFGGPIQGIPPSSLSLDVTDFSLSEWAGLGGQPALQGLANFKTTIETASEGKQIGLSVQGGVTGLSLPFGTNSLENLNVELNTSGRIESSTGETLNLVSLPNTTITLRQGSTRLLYASASLRYNTKSSDGNLQSSLELMLPALVKTLKLPDMTLTDGTLKLNSSISLKANSQTLSSDIQLQALSGKIGSINFVNYQTAIDINAEISPDQINLQRLLISLADEKQKGGSINLNGNYATQLGSGKFDLAFVGVNEAALRPFLADSLGDNQLTSILLEGRHALTITNWQMVQMQSSQQVTNWVISNRKTGEKLGPLAIGLSIDGTFSPKLVDLRQLSLQLSPTARAQNKLDLRAFIDLNTTNAKPSNITLSSPALDITPYADMFASKKTAEPAAKPSPTTPPSSAGGSTEPAAIALPIRQAMAKIDIGRFYLRELSASNILVEARIDNGKIAVKPFSLDMNGAPIRGDLAMDVSVPGYIYALGLKIQSLPLSPLTGDTNLNGNLSTDIQVNGKGVTGPSLKKNLEGTVNLNLTNMHRQIVTGWAKTIITPIALLLNLPEIQNTPVGEIDARVKISGGRVNLQPVIVKSDAFQAEAGGGITIAEVLTNSAMAIPVKLSLKYSLAEKAGLLAPNTPTNASYSALPDFVTVKGTVGTPAVDIDKLKLAGLTARGLLGSGLTRSLGLGKGVGEALGGAANFLTGQSASTNAPGTNNTPAGNLLQGLGGLLGGAKNTSTNAPASTNRISQGDALLQGLGGLFNKPKPATNDPAKK